MNLWLRILWYLLRLHGEPRLEMPEESSVFRFRVWPNDLDTSIHMNNGRYLTLMDLGRLDVMVRSGLWRRCSHYWTPVANAVIVRFRRELRLFAALPPRNAHLAWRKPRS